MNSTTIKLEIARLQAIVEQRDRAFHRELKTRYSNWCLAARATPDRIARYGKVFTPKTMKAEQDAWEARNPMELAL